jgi:hypothetical protein
MHGKNERGIINDRIILKCILKIQGMRLCTEFISLRTGSYGMVVIFGFREGREIS